MPEWSHIRLFDFSMALLQKIMSVCAPWHPLRANIWEVQGLPVLHMAQDICDLGHQDVPEYGIGGKSISLHVQHGWVWAPLRF